MTAIPQPPPDLSGGYLLMKYTNGVDTHRQRIHVHNFSASPAGSLNDRLYVVGPDPTPGEAGLIATFTAWAAIWSQYYQDVWTLVLDGIFFNNGTLVSQVFPTPTTAPVVGGSSIPVNPSNRAAEQQFNFRSVGGLKGKIIFIAPAQWNYGTVSEVAANSGGSTQEQTVAYLTGSATGLRCHDGTQFTPPAHVTNPYNRRLRRHYGEA